MHANFDCLLLKIDFRRGSFSQSGGYIIQKVFCPNHGGASLNSKHVGPPKIFFVSTALGGQSNESLTFAPVIANV